MNPLPRRRYIAFAAAAIALAVLGAFGALLTIDLYLHAKYERTASVNIWGYRGPTVDKKMPGSIRVVVLGGSTAFGYGPDWDGSFPYFLEERLSASGNRRFSVVNLAYNNEGAYSFRYTLEDYEYLDYDIAILYEGYNDVQEGLHYQLYRHQSAIFRLTGYLPIYPTVFREKAWAMLYGDINRGYSGKQTVFNPGLAATATAKALEAAASTTQSLERQLGRLSATTAAAVTASDGCGDRWREYCGAVHMAIAWARERGKAVLVGTQPFISDDHIDQQNALAGLLAQQFSTDSLVRHVDLGRAVDLANRALCYDGMHLLAAGNRIIAEGFVQPVVDMANKVTQVR